MNKLLLLKEKKAIVGDREIVTVKSRQYLVADAARDFHTTYGVIKSKDLQKKDGSAIKSSTAQNFVVLTPSFVDLFKRLKKFAQTIPLKDVAIIAAETGIGKDSVIFDAGVGSGALACYLANVCKKVISYDIRDESIEMAKSNIGFLGLQNITVKKHDVYKGFSDKNADAITLDLPEPWRALEGAAKSLKTGGYVATYSPSVTQVMQTVQKMEKMQCWEIIKSIELIERPWKVKGEAVRPANTPIGHSGFVTFARKIK